MTYLSLIAVISLGIWVYLLVFRGKFWLSDQRLDGSPCRRDAWPAVVALVPARDEAEVVGRCIKTLLDQDYPGDLRVILIDDHSTDATGRIARDAASGTVRPDALTIIRSESLPPGWAGKVWALSEGLRAAEDSAPDARYVWLTDADIAHDPVNLRRLVGKAEVDDLDLVSQMVVLVSDGLWARLLIPAFVYFFQKLYPFRWVNEPRHALAAAAGGCVLLRRGALRRIAGFDVIKDALIDDCSLAKAVKSDGREGGGRIWLGLTRSATSLRPYHGLRGIWRMVARSAYTQLRYSKLLLFGTLLGMAMTYVAPPLLVLAWPWHGVSIAAILAGLAWLLMLLSFLPILRLYGQPAVFAPFLPLAGILYGAMTLDSAIAHWRGRGGAWKGRIETSPHQTN
jgi:hopene-associated glycosyltransferase HpnB